MSQPDGSNPLSPRQEMFARLVIVLVATLIGLGGLELALRILKPPAVGYYGRMPDIFQPDEEAGYLFIPGSGGVYERTDYYVRVHINQAGFYDDEFQVERIPGVKRIAVIGDSFTAGIHVQQDETYPNRLESILNDSQIGCPCEVYNFGVNGYAAANSLVVLKNIVLTYQPDMVIFGLYENDIKDAGEIISHRASYRGFEIFYLTDDQRQQALERIDTYLSKFQNQLLAIGLQYSYIVRGLYGLAPEHPELDLGRSRVQMITAQDVAIPDLTQEDMQESVINDIQAMSDLCADHCTFVVVAIPAKDTSQGHDPDYASPILAQLAERGIPAINVLDRFKQEIAAGHQLYWTYDGHCNSTGYDVIAQEIAGFIASNDLLK